MSSVSSVVAKNTTIKPDENIKMIVITGKNKMELDGNKIAIYFIMPVRGRRSN